jgi:hypothetical protein
MPLPYIDDDIARMRRLARYVQRHGTWDGFDPEALPDLREVAPQMKLVVFPK